MSELLFGYNTNGFAHHSLDGALQVIIDFGYNCFALTLDHHVLNPFAGDFQQQLVVLRYYQEFLAHPGVIETGARFLLDPRVKHQPTLISPTRSERDTRLDFLSRAVDIAAESEFNLVSFWSGTPVDTVAPKLLMRRLVEECRRLCDLAAKRNVRLAFEPEPGMFIDTMDKYAELFERVNHPAFGLTLDIGHLQCMGELPMEPHIRRWKDVLWNVHIEDMKRGVHDHLMFGEGEIDFPPVLQCLREVGYTGGVHVELSRHSHNAVETARQALEFLRSI